MLQPEPLLSGLVFPEGPRWHAGRLWIADMFGGRVLTVDLAGRSTVVLELDDRPSGLGFLPDGTPLLVAMDRRAVLRLTGSGPVPHADLGSFAASHLNDMVVDAQGRAYVDCLAHRLPPPSPQPVDQLALVGPDGSVRIVADGLVRPNGLAISPQSRPLGG